MWQGQGAPTVPTTPTPTLNPNPNPNALRRYVEYDASGRVIKGEEVRAHSRYEEDAYINNHTAVWGSFWRDGAWGYACCRSTVKQSYCVGHAGVAAEQAQVCSQALVRA